MFVCLDLKGEGEKEEKCVIKIRGKKARRKERVRCIDISNFANMLLIRNQEYQKDKISWEKYCRAVGLSLDKGVTGVFREAYRNRVCTGEGTRKEWRGKGKK